VYETTGVDYRQASFVYLWLACVIGPFIIWDVFQDAPCSIPHSLS
jgi:hypothetical protein